MKASKYLEKQIQNERKRIMEHKTDKFEEYTHLDEINGALKMARMLELIKKKKYIEFSKQVADLMDYIDDL